MANSPSNCRKARALSRGRSSKKAKLSPWAGIPTDSQVFRLVEAKVQRSSSNRTSTAFSTGITDLWIRPLT